MRGHCGWSCIGAVGLYQRVPEEELVKRRAWRSPSLFVIWDSTNELQAVPKEIVYGAQGHVVDICKGALPGEYEFARVEEALV